MKALDDIEPVEPVVVRDEADLRRTLIEDVFHREHPRLRRQDIVATKEGDDWIIALDGGAVHFKGTFLSPQMVGLGQVDPRDHAVLLAPAISRAIPYTPPSAGPAAPDPIAIALGLAQRCAEAVNEIRRDGPAWQALVAVTTLTDLRTHYPGVSPLPWPGEWEDYKAYNDSTLHDLHLKICEAVRLHRTVPPMVTAHQQLVIEATRAIQGALVEVTAQAARPNLRTAGATRMLTSRPPAENALDDGQDRVDELRRAVQEITAELPHLIEVTPQFAVAGLQVLREGRIAAVTLYIERQKRELAKLKDYPAEREAAAAVALISDQVIPAMRWSDPLTPPVLEQRNGERL